MGDNPIKEISRYSNPRPIWFIYTGTGCQWRTMGRDLLNMELFRRSFERCAAALKTHELDLCKIVTDDDDSVFESCSHILAGITAIQVALTDVLSLFDIIPDGMAGHSLGETGN